jgi:hypothetical protein
VYMRFRKSLTGVMQFKNCRPNRVYGVGHRIYCNVIVKRSQWMLPVLTTEKKERMVA